MHRRMELEGRMSPFVLNVAYRSLKRLGVISQYTEGLPSHIPPVLKPSGSCTVMYKVELVISRPLAVFGTLQKDNGAGCCRPSSTYSTELVSTFTRWRWDGNKDGDIQRPGIAEGRCKTIICETPLVELCKGVCTALSSGSQLMLRRDDRPLAR